MGKILVVDPMLMDQARLQSVLEAVGHTLVISTSPDDAIAKLSQWQRGAVQLILTELVFPEADGLDLVRWVKREAQWREVPIILLTPQPARERLIEAVRLGAATVLSKPFGPDMLLRRVTEALTEHAAIAQGDEGNLSWEIGDYLRRQLKRAQRTRESFSLILLQIRGTDQSAQSRVMGGLIHAVRETDVMARIGDEEVVVLLPDTGPDGAQVLTERIGQMIAQLRADSGERAPLQAQVFMGMASFPSEVADGDSLIRLARERCNA
jgi:PleD family two-component response regulator